MKRVLVFGTFDPLHEGHVDFFRQARALGDYLTVVVARDAVIERQKKHLPFQVESQRLQTVQAVSYVDEAVLGDEDPASYDLLERLTFDVLALGYDQRPDESMVREVLVERGKENVEVVRCQPYKPDQFKSSFMRTAS